MKAMLLVAAMLLSGCGVVDVGGIEQRALQYGGKYCGLSPEARLAVRNRVNRNLPAGVSCAVVQCEGDAPIACPFLQ